MSSLPPGQGRMARLIRHLNRQGEQALPIPVRLESVRLYETGAGFFEALFAALDTARSLICLEYYIIRADRTGGRLAELLVRARERGVAVFLLYDALGCHETAESYFSLLREQGVQCLPFNPFSFRRGIRWFDRRDHRKLAVIDGRQAFLGGINIGDEYAGLMPQADSFHDVGFSVQGIAVDLLLGMFAETWAMECGIRPEFPAFSAGTAPAVSDAEIVLISGGPHQRGSTIRSAFRVAMASAGNELLIVNPYFVPGPRILRSFLRAAQRGVEVTLLLPARSDVPLVKLVSRSTYEPLLKAGIKIFELERQLLHAKLMLIDGERTLLGSANLDQRSFHRNYEINAIIHSRSFADQVSRLFARDLAGSRKITLDEHNRRGFLVRLLEWMLKPICWFL